MPRNCSNIPLWRWMCHLRSDIREHVPIIHLAIPGAYHLVTFEAQDTDAGKKLIDQSTAYMYLYIPNETPMELENASNKNISRELMKGVRFFAFCVTKPSDDIEETEFHVDDDDDDESNSSYKINLQQIEGAVQIIRRFLDKNPHEFIILDFQSFRNMLYSNHLSLQDHLNETFGSMMFTRLDGKLKNLTLMAAQEKSKQVLIIYRMSDVPLHFWPGRYWPISSPKDTSVYANLNEFFIKSVQNRDWHRGQILQYVVRSEKESGPTFLNFWRLCSVMIAQVGQKAEAWVKSHCSKLQGDKHSKINVFMLDNVNFENSRLANLLVSINTLLNIQTPVDIQASETAKESKNEKETQSKQLVDTEKRKSTESGSSKKSKKSIGSNRTSTEKRRSTGSEQSKGHAGKVGYSYFSEIANLDQQRLTDD
ncbi:unnamed protein product [Hermetia illucens]|uniref:Uncharacterized protein n=1 Tax=Hermetia illucens TaxID=343691 RepID=A0A7R8YNR2_HERIL|nr:uncharacterized protein LOC119661343 [Hermetia illucens]CAD7079848.1 unnamed protein product [Hermetia illucens]